VASNAPFTADEQAEIGRRIDEALQLVAESPDLNDEQKAAVSLHLSHSKESRDRLGREDWIVMFSSSIISTGVTDAVPPSVFRAVLGTVPHGLGHLFGIGVPPSITSA
jgi:hypothetical protein